MKIEEINKQKVPVVRIDKSLNKFKGKVLFPGKLEMANTILKNVGLPQTK